MITAILAAASLGSIAIDSQCTGRFSTYEAGPSLKTEQEILKTVKDQLARDIDPKLAKDKESKEHAAKFNKNLTAKTSDVASIDGIKIKATLAAGYYSLSDPYIGKTYGIVWQEKDGKALPLYSISSCHYSKPDISVMKTDHGTYFLDNSLANISSVSKAPIIWKIEGSSIVRTDIDKALEAEASKVIKSSNMESLALASGFDVKTLTYKGKAKVKNDCAACYTGPEVTIKLIPQKDGYKAESTF